ncbi:tyrosyl-tRNA synthetase [Infirmifilum uzonense]|uniref:Tyrosine--tRNA ligase n=1 Tax=Infirmifilum uzonense TaxID=1550241 RepID=A0A0F7FK48_9CREN|nr:tyrosyl-tRNA synthetase [Infirmifilum uzonense]
MHVQDILRLTTREPAEELLTPERLTEMVEQGVRLKHYIGFEVSGLVHLGTGLISMQKVVDLQKAGIETTVFLADYHSWINKKLGGDLSTIRRVAGGYFKEALKVSIKIAGGDPEKTKFLMGSEVYEKLGLEYFTNVVKVSMDTTLSRVRRSITILGRREAESLSFAQLLYVPMQVADIFSMGVNIAHGGMDQRKAHVIAIEVGERAFSYKPVALHHHLLPGLALDQVTWERLVEAKRRGDKDEFSDAIADVKMSKSKPETAIFIHDREEDVRKKILGAFCPAGETELNPVLEIARYIIFRDRSEPLEVVNKKTGARLIFSSYLELEESYKQRKVHPLDLKHAVADELARILEPARRHFTEGPGRSYLEDLESITITR